MGFYLGGLKPEIASCVKLFNPQTILEASKLARLQDFHMDRGMKEAKKFMWMYKANGSNATAEATKAITLGSIAPSTSRPAAQDQKGILGKPNYRFLGKMTPSKLEEHKSKNMCFFYHEKFSPTHSSPQRKCKKNN